MDFFIIWYLSIDVIAAKGDASQQNQGESIMIIFLHVPHLTRWRAAPCSIYSRMRKTPRDAVGLTKRRRLVGTSNRQIPLELRKFNSDGDRC